MGKRIMDDINEVDESPAVYMPAGPSKPGPDVKPPPTNGIVEDVDLATFKSTFISKPKDKKKEKENKQRKRSKGGALLSFDVDVDGGELLSLTVAHQKH
jgi:G patch domain-containing protein 1